MRLLSCPLALTLASACCLTIVSAKSLLPSDGLEYIDALVTTNRYCPVRCAKEIFQPESTEDLANWMRSKRSEFEHITVKGGGHSYGCQSVPMDGQALIHTQKLDKAEVVIRDDGTIFARLGAGLTTLDVIPGLHKMGYSMPHGMCLTVGLAGWLLNLGNHPETSNYANFYGAGTSYLKKITGVDYDGNIFTIDKSGLNYVDRSPSMSESELRERKQKTQQLANALDFGLNTIAGMKDGIPSESIEMRMMQMWGASLMVATEFEIELLDRKEPPYLYVMYDMSLFQQNGEKLLELYKITVEPDPALINCGLNFISKLMEGGKDAIALKCIDMQDEDGANVLKLVPEGYSDVATLRYGGILAWSKDSYGTGWLPEWYAQPSFVVSQMGGLERWRQAVLALASEANPCTNCLAAMGYADGLDLNLFDTLCGSTPEHQNACNSFVLETNQVMRAGLPKVYKQNLPNCEANPKWIDEIFEYSGGLYDLAQQAKMVWDTNMSVDFWLGIGHEGQGDQCEAFERVNDGPTCATNSITANDLVESVRRSVIKYCPEFFEYDSAIGQNSGCEKYMIKHARPLSSKKATKKASKKGKKEKKKKNKGKK